MSVKAMDQVFTRWFLDAEFRAQMNECPEQALAGYDLTGPEREKVSRLSRKVRCRARTQQCAIEVVVPHHHPAPAPFKLNLPDGDPNNFSLN